MQRLREELSEKGQQHKQELVELRLARDQELHSMEADFQSQVSLFISTGYFKNSYLKPCVFV